MSTAPTAPIRWRLRPRQLRASRTPVVNFMTLKMNVEFDEGADHKAVMQDVLKACKRVESDCEIFI